MSGKKWRAAVITHSSPYEPRAELAGRCLAAGGYSVTWYEASFDHHLKRQRVSDRADHVYLPMRPYRKNLSLKRIMSLMGFAKEVGRTLESEHYDLLYFMVPLNSFLPLAIREKEKGSRIVIDIVDLWPEALPLERVDGLWPVRWWRSLRDKHLHAADRIYLECDRYRDFLPDAAKGAVTLYWSGGESADRAPLAERGAGREDGRITLAYIGSINHIIDVEGIADLVRTLKRAYREVCLSVIGDGEGRGRFLSALEGSGAHVDFYGRVYDEEEKARILQGADFGLNLMKASVVVGLTMKSIDYLSRGIPLINNIRGDSFRLVEEKGIGVNLTVDGDLFLERISRLMGDREVSARVRRVYEEKFSTAACLSLLEQTLFE